MFASGLFIFLRIDKINLMLAIEKKVKPIDGPNAPWVLIIILLILFGISVSVFSKKSPAPALPGNTDPAPSAEARMPRIYNVSYRAGVFSPTNLRIHVGDTVRFKNEGFYPIRVTSDSSTPDRKDLPGFDSIGDIPQNSYFSFTFSATGIFGYHNERDTGEAGTIIVR